MGGRSRARTLASGLLVVLAACSPGGGRGDGSAAPAPSPTTVGGTATNGSGYGPPAQLGTIEDSAVRESSGLVASRRSPGQYWTHNDSDDGPFLYCLGSRGEPCGTWRVRGADAFDWEDIAAGPGPDPSTSYLYIGDIGDNLGDRPDVVVYRVAEPLSGEAPAPSGASPAVTEPAEALTLRYPDGSHDAEALLVHPETGDLYIVVKEVNPRVYVVRAPIRPATVHVLEPVATLAIGAEVTGGDIARDGRRVALCTYAAGYELRLPPDAASFDAVWQQPPQPLVLGPRAQGEAIAYRLDGKALLTTSESPLGGPSALYQIEFG